MIYSMKEYILLQTIKMSLYILFMITGVCYAEHVTEGSTVIFSCPTTYDQSVWWTVRTVLHSEGDRRYIYRNGLMVDSFSKTNKFSAYSEGNVFFLRITDTSVYDAGKYQCIEQEGMSDNPKTYTLTIGVNSSSGKYDSIIQQHVALFGKVTIPCIVRRPNSMSSWLQISPSSEQYKITHGDRIEIDANYSLTLSDVNVNDNGWFVCVNLEERTVTSMSLVELIVNRISDEYAWQYAPDILKSYYMLYLEYQSVLSSSENDTVEMYCPYRSVWWLYRREKTMRPIYRNQLMIESFRSDGRFRVVDSTLKVSSITQTDTGEYDCVDVESGNFYKYFLRMKEPLLLTPTYVEDTEPIKIANKFLIAGFTLNSLVLFGIFIVWVARKKRVRRECNV